MSAARLLGVDLDGLCPTVAYRDLDAGRVRLLDLGVAMPPSALLGTLPGEKLAHDFRVPPDPRGVGIDAGPVARPGSEAGGSARFPLAYAWEWVLGDPDKRWRWRASEEQPEVAVSPEEGIAAVLAGVLERTASHQSPEDEAGTPGPQRLVVVVPNHLDDTRQDRLLRACRSRTGSLNPVLVWRPVAAALAFVERHQDDLALDEGGLAHHAGVGQLLHVHLGIESFEATLIELVPHREGDQQWLLPGRRLPYEGSSVSLSTQPRRLLEQIAAIEVGERAPHIVAARLWNMLWGTPWTHALMGIGSGAAQQLPPWISWSDGASGFLQFLSDITAGTGVRPAGAAGALSDVRLKIDSWRHEVAKLARANNLIGCVVTGPLATMPSKNGQSTGQALVRQALGYVSFPVLVESGQGGLLAEGASIVARRLARGEPTYLDTLPRVDIIALIEAEPAWVNLLETDDPWVVGGRTWSSTPKQTRFEVAEGEDRLNLVVHRGGAPTCRSVDSTFEAAAQKAVPVRLDVEMMPGQGSPVVRVVPEDRRLVREGSVRLDWDTATDTKLSREEQLDNVQRVCPPLEKRRSSARRWGGVRFSKFGGWSPVGVRDLVRAYVDGEPAVWKHRYGGRLSVLDELLVQLSARDAKENGFLATAIDSDSQVNPEFMSRDGGLPDRLASKLMTELQSARQWSHKDLVLKVAAHAAVGSEAWMDYLRDTLIAPRAFGHDARTLALVWGMCLRDAEDIDRMMHSLHSDFITSDQLMAICRVCMFREHALRHVPSGLALSILRLAAERASECVRRRSFKILFRSSALVIIYMLRRRKYDPGFVEPGSDAHQDLEYLFKAALNDLARQPGLAIGGAFSIEDIVKSILNYLDKRGSGTLVGLAFDDSGSEKPTRGASEEDDVGHAFDKVGSDRSALLKLGQDLRQRGLYEKYESKFLELICAFDGVDRRRMLRLHDSAKSMQGNWLDVVTYLRDVGLVGRDEEGPWLSVLQG